MNAKENFIKQCKGRFYNCYKDLDGKNVVLFAAGGRAQAMILAFREMNIGANILAVLDNYCVKGKCMEGIPIYGADKIEDFLDSIILICSDTYRNEIKAQVHAKGGRVFDIPNWEGLIEQMLTLHEYKTKIEQDPIGDVYSWIGNPISKERIQFVSAILEDEKSKIVFEKRMRLLVEGNLNDFIKIPVDEIQYFDHDVLNLTQDEVFVDCGAYVGDTIESFRKSVGGGE